ncbi:MAG: hypothetical protein KGH60_04800 [Candidatus Micrarchaeota archaeon]|nr:hypothetical protein [Candidatus Micrarchaeota archaeon]
MPEVAVLFDVNALLKEPKDVSQYMFEVIQNVFGHLIDNIDMSDYEGMTSQEMVIAILKKNGINDSDINGKLANYIEEVPYSHYNVAGHDAITVADGAKDALESLRKSTNVVVGMATGQMERITRNMFERAHMDMDSYFKIGAYGSISPEFSKILEDAVSKAESRGVSRANIYFVSGAPQPIAIAKSLGVKPIGVAFGKYSKAELEQAGASPAVKNVKDVVKLAR